MRKFRLPAFALIVVGTLNMLAFVFIAGHREFTLAAYSQDYLSGSNIPVQLPAWIGRMP